MAWCEAIGFLCVLHLLLCPFCFRLIFTVCKLFPFIFLLLSFCLSLSFSFSKIRKLARESIASAFKFPSFFSPLSKCCRLIHTYILPTNDWTATKCSPKPPLLPTRKQIKHQNFYRKQYKRGEAKERSCRTLNGSDILALASLLDGK